MPLGLYLSVPFCRTKCSYCNFASDVFSRAVFQRYVERVCSDIVHAAETAEQMGGHMERAVDSVYLGGGTPTVLDIAQLERLFVTISQKFDLQPEAEITVECAPGTLTPALLKSFQHWGVNRVSLGVQSFVDEEARAVGRLHQRATVFDDIAHLRESGISNINVDLIAGLPHQTTKSWEFSLQQAIVSGVPHASVYMLEVDEDSRLGRELIAGGTRYHAHFVPDEDVVADSYEAACQRLEEAGVQQYEISNFARPGHESRHNLKYWTRQPYVGFGVDGHSMLKAAGAKAPCNDLSNLGLKASSSAEPKNLDQKSGQSRNGHPLGGTVKGHDFSRADQEPADGRGCGANVNSVRFSASDSLEQYMAAGPLQRTVVSQRAALEESFFLGLRLNRGMDLGKVEAKFGKDTLSVFTNTIADCVDAELLERRGNIIRLTPRGRLLSNEVFERFISVAEIVG